MPADSDVLDSLAELDAGMRERDFDYARELADRLLAPLPNQRPSQWAIENIIFDEPEIKGPFTLEGRHYTEEPIDNIDDDSVRKETYCWGTGNGKTIVNMVKAGWAFENEPFRGLWVMPAKEGEGGARQFNNTRMSKMVRASRCFQNKIPSGAERHKFSGLRLEFAGNILGFVGSNSPGQVGANRCRLVFKDETDKFKSFLTRDPITGEYKESGANYLADERTKQVPRSKKMGSSTPTTESGIIWKDLMSSDLRRRFLPCPHCGRHHPSSKRFVLVKDAQFTVLPTKMPDGAAIAFAELRWDKQAKRRDGSWDYDRVVRSARFECPHCGGHITDNHRLWLDQNGVWIPTNPAVRDHRGYHLPSFYAPWTGRDYESSWGGMAKKFLEKLEQNEVSGFINSDLAEVNAHQQHVDKTVIEISSDKPQPTSVIRTKTFSIDHQQLYPKFWYIVREWIASILRPARTAEQQTAFLKSLPSDQKALVDKLAGSPGAAAVPAAAGVYSPHNILAQVQRTDHWPAIADWLIANTLTGKSLAQFFREEFQSDLIRLLEFVAKQKEVNVNLGRQGDSQALEIGSADSWDELNEIQQRQRVANTDVIIDARFGERDNSEVFAECFRRCVPAGFCYFMPIGAGGRFFPSPIPGGKPFALAGWRPVMGFPEHKVWPNKDKIRLPYGLVIDDPYKGTIDARKYLHYVFQFDAQWALSELAKIRKKYAWELAHSVQFTGYDSKMGKVNLAEYNRHMKGYFWNSTLNCWDAPAKGGGSQSRARPNHLYDCEKNAAAYAVWKGIFRYERAPGSVPPADGKPQGS